MVLSLPVNSFSSSNTFLTAANILWKWVHLLITFVCIKYVLLYYLLHLPLTNSIVLISCERGYNHYFVTSSIIFVSVYNISTSVETAWSIVIHVSLPRTTLFLITLFLSSSSKSSEFCDQNCRLQSWCGCLIDIWHNLVLRFAL